MAFKLPPETLGFLRDLEANNSKAWFDSQRKRYEAELKKPAQALATALDAELARVCPSHAGTPPNKALNRINRDIRFLADKSPYNTKVWASFARTGAAKGASAGFFFGFMLNLSFWPFSLDPTSSVAYEPGAAFLTQWHRYLVFDATTSLGWDTGRAVTNFVCILLAGPAVLAAFRRASRRANFRPHASFRPHAGFTSADVAN